MCGGGKSYQRLSRPSARKAFEAGKSLLVMSIDRNPIESLSSPHFYKKGCKAYMFECTEVDTINTFDELLEDFSQFLDTDGYGHMPQRYDAANYRFSYWLSVE